MTKHGKIIINLLVGICISCCTLAQSPIDTEQAYKIFKETKALCIKDNGMLWGRTLIVPLIFVDPLTGFIVANEDDTMGLLTPKGNVFIGTLPSCCAQRKGVIKYGGKTWAIIPWPLSSDYQERQQLIIHESFHCLQPKLDLTPQPYNNQHMDSLEARIWLKLEWQALLRALNVKGELRREAITDALCFRAYRRAIFSLCDGCENRFEIHEGMADYTSMKICLNEKQILSLLPQKMKHMWNSKSFVNCFAYCSGPIYGHLLDASGIDWRTHLGCRDDLATIVQKAYNITLPKDLFLSAEERSVLYESAQILGEELDRQIEL